MINHGNQGTNEGHKSSIEARYLSMVAPYVYTVSEDKECAGQACFPTKVGEKFEAATVELSCLHSSGLYIEPHRVEGSRPKRKQ